MSDSEVDLGFSMRMDDSQPESEIPAAYLYYSTGH